jgi:RNA polymerase sigma factor FliA
MAKPATHIESEHLELVRRIARKVKRDGAARVSRDDLEGHGMDGLMQAAQRFDREGDASFRTFAGYRIRGAMLDAMRRQRRAPKTLALDEESVPGPDMGGEERVVTSETRRRLRQALEGLPGPERSFIERVYFGNKDLAAAAAELTRSRSWASRVHARALRRLRQAMDA